MDSYVKLITGNNFVIPHETFHSAQKTSGQTTDEFLQTLANEARMLAKPFFPNVAVGTAAIAHPSGRVYIGINIDYEGFLFNMCAERFAIARALNEGEFGFGQLASSKAPCGSCIETLNRFGAGDQSVKIAYNGRPKPTPVNKLIRTLSTKSKTLNTKYEGVSGRRYTPLKPFEEIHLLEPASFITQEVLRNAYDALKKSYSPKFNSPASVTLFSADFKEQHTGSYGDLSLHNGGVFPVWGAVAKWVAHGLDFPQIAHVLVLEKKDAHMKHASTTRFFRDNMFEDAKIHIAQI